jgi:hypothetical protein
MLKGIKMEMGDYPSEENVLYIYGLKVGLLKRLKASFQKKYDFIDQEFMKSMNLPSELPTEIKAQITSLLRKIRNSEQQSLNAVRDIEDWCSNYLDGHPEEVYKLYEDMRRKNPECFPDDNGNYDEGEEI